MKRIICYLLLFAVAFLPSCTAGDPPDSTETLTQPDPFDITQSIQSQEETDMSVDSQTLDRLYFGSYTDGEKTGIYTAEIDEISLSVSDVRELAEIQNPTYLAQSADGKYMYALSEVGDHTKIYSFTVGEAGALTRQSELDVPGSGLCHISLSGDGMTLYGACYSSGDVFSAAIKEDGSLDKIISHFQHDDFDDISSAKPHAHCIVESPDAKYVVAADLGLDALIVYSNDGGRLERHSYLSFNKGEGPRHIVFNPRDKSLLYLITEYSSVLYALQMSDDGQLSVLESVLNLQNEGDKSSGAAVKISPDCTMIAASNRHHSGDGTIAVYSIADDGIPKNKQVVTSGGVHPRDFIFSKDGTSLIVANQQSDDVAVVNIQTQEVRTFAVSQVSYVAYSQTN